MAETSDQAENRLRELVLDSYIVSGRENSFNGVRADVAAARAGIAGSTKEVIAALVRQREIDCVFGRIDVNAHIKRLPELRVADQLKYLSSEVLSSICLYPTRSVLSKSVPSGAFRDQPFSRALLLGDAQLSFAAFDLAALGRYRADPRFEVTFEDYVGTMSVTGSAWEDAGFPDRDKVSVQSFGLGFDEDRLPCVVVFYRYLANLTPEHQQFWNSFLIEGSVEMCDPYFQSSILGEFWSNRSVRNAIGEEVRLINAMSRAAFGRSLFRTELSSDLPFDLSAFLVPSTENYDRFVHSWDKMLSDNINKKFFAGVIELERDEPRADGKVKVIEKGTLVLLEEWLVVTLGEEARLTIDSVMKPLRAVRRQRQEPAHRFRKNEFSKDFHAERRRTLSSIYEALKTLREAMSRCPGAEKVEVPAWLVEEPIDVF